MLGHHPFTNIDGHDPDIMTSAPELPDFRRIKPNQRWIAYYFYQHLYCPLLYCLVSNISYVHMTRFGKIDHFDSSEMERCRDNQMYVWCRDGRLMQRWPGLLFHTAVQTLRSQQCPAQMMWDPGSFNKITCMQIPDISIVVCDYCDDLFGVRGAYGCLFFLLDPCCHHPPPPPHLHTCTHTSATLDVTAVPVNTCQSQAGSTISNS